MDQVEGEPSAKRKRVTKACDSCSRKRKRCDGQTPCSICAAAGKGDDCTYTKVQKKRGPPAGYNRAAQESVERLKLLSVLLQHITEESPQFLDALLSGVQTLNNINNLTARDARLQAFNAGPINQWLDQRMSEKEAASASPANAAPSSTHTDAQDANDSFLSGPFDIFPPAASTSMNVDGVEPPDFHQFQQNSQNLSPLASIPTQSQSQASPSSLVSAPQSMPVAQEPLTPAVPLHFGPTSNVHQLGPVREPYFSTSSGRTGPSAPQRSEPSFWPAEDVVNGLLDTYFQSWHAVIPIIDKQLMLTWLMEHSSQNAERATRLSGDAAMATGTTPKAESEWSPRHHHNNPASSTSSATVPSELVFAVFACALPYTAFECSQLRQQGLSVGKFVAQSEMGLTSSNKLGCPSVSTIQSRVLLSFACLGLGQLARASHHFASALSAALDLGLHRQTSSVYSSQETESFVRRTWWAIFILDVLFALRFGRPTLIQQELVDVPLPSNSGSEEVELWRPGIDLAHLRSRVVDASRQMSKDLHADVQLPATPASFRVVRAHALSGFCELIKLCGIGALIATRLNQARSQASPEDASHLHDILNRLHVWELSLPPQLKSSRSAADSNTSADELMLMHRALMLLCLRPVAQGQLLNEHCLAALNSASEDVTAYVQSCAVLRARPGFEYFTFTIAATMALTATGTQQWSTCLIALNQQAVLYPAAQQALLCLQNYANRGLSKKKQKGAQERTQAQSNETKAMPMAATMAPNSVEEESSWTEGNAPFDAMQGWGGLASSEPGIDILQGEFDFLTNPSQDVLSLLGLKGPTRPASPSGGPHQQEQAIDRDLLSRFQHQGDWTEERDSFSDLSFMLMQ